MFELVQKNQRRSALLVSLMFGLLVAIGFVSAENIQPGTGALGVLAAAALGLLLFLVSYYQGSAVLLASAGAHEVRKQDAPQLFNVVEEMVIASGLKSMPRLYVIESNVANAFASGRAPEVAAIAVTEGLLTLCSRDELQAVIGHEISHVKNRDILYMTLLAVMAGAIALISNVMMRYFYWGGRRSRSSSSRGGGQAQVVILLVGIALFILGAVIARLVFFAASRTREYLADAGSAIYTRNPAALASALEKISANVTGNKLPVPKVAQAMLIVGPALFETHPPIASRIAILRRLAGGTSLSFSGYVSAYRAETGASARFMPKSALAVAPMSMPERPAQPAAQTPPTVQPFRREALDSLKIQAGYQIFTCACGAIIKIPANHPQRALVKCLRCGRPVGAA